MRIAVRFRYYKAVTPSMEIVDLTDQQWREFFLLEDAAKRKDYMMNLVDKDKIDVKELWWIPLDDQEALAVAPEAKIINVGSTTK